MYEGARHPRGMHAKHCRRTEPRRIEPAGCRRRLHMLRGAAGPANQHSQEDDGGRATAAHSEPGSDSHNSDRDEVPVGTRCRRRRESGRGGRGGSSGRGDGRGRQEDEKRGEQEGSSRSVEREEGADEAGRLLRRRRRCEGRLRLHTKLQ